MRILIGDSPFNQRFLAIAARTAGFSEIMGAATADDLLDAAVVADVIAFDPSIRCARGELDVALHLLRLVPRTRLIVVSSRSTDLERAELNGIASARKWSILQLEPFVAAMALVRDRVAAQLLAERAASPVLPLEPRSAREESEDVPAGPSADASVLAASGGPTW